MRAFFDRHRGSLDPIRSLSFDNPDTYAQFLAQTRHYVVHTTRLLGATAARIGEDREALHTRFMAHAAEEKSHHLLADHDLRKLGRSIDDYPEMPLTTALYQAQYYRVEHTHPTSIFGYIFALEGLAVLHGEWIHQAVCEAHGAPAATFVRLHANEDVDHLDKSFDAVAHLPPDEIAQIQDNFRFTTALYGMLVDQIQAAGAA